MCTQCVRRIMKQFICRATKIVFGRIQIDACSSTSQSTGRVRTSNDILHNAFLVEISDATRWHVRSFAYTCHTRRTFPQIRIRAEYDIRKKLVPITKSVIATIIAKNLSSYTGFSHQLPNIEKTVEIKPRDEKSFTIF